MTVRLQVRAKPGSSRESVTVAESDDGDDVLVVRVRARAVDGAANKAVVLAVAQALGVRRSAVTLARGAKSRLKWVDVEGSDSDTAAAIAALPREVPPA